KALEPRGVLLDVGERRLVVLEEVDAAAGALLLVLRPDLPPQARRAPDDPGEVAERRGHLVAPRAGHREVELHERRHGFPPLRIGSGRAPRPGGAPSGARRGPRG